ncbi:MAG: hypothetical protein DRR19_18835 [Candidatus Parabeggiatoa sp. nov. 1]|nr:MAG: hypothetical protein DRR19_18835 [Gammaproteobacteria bacterium]
MSPQAFPIILSFLLIGMLNAVKAEIPEPTRHVKQRDALRIEITEEGIYWLSYQELAAAGLQPQWINPKRLRLFNQSKEIAIQVISEQRDKFEPGDYIVFYAQGLDTTFTDTNVYWLYWRKKGLGKRMALIDGAVTGQRDKITAFYDRFHIEQNRRWDIWDGSPDTQDYWFWQRLNASDVKNYTVELPALPLEQTDIMVRVGFRGRSAVATNPDHHTLVYLNETLIGDERWDGDSEYVQEMLVSSALFEKRNTLTIELPGDTGAVVDTVYLNWIELDYWRSVEAVADSLILNLDGLPNLGELPQEIQVEVNKLSQPEILIYDITNPFEVVEIINFSIEFDGQNYQATFEDTVTDTKTYYIATLAQLKPPPNITLFQPARLKSVKNGADYILITAMDLLPAVQPLSELRRRQGLRVKSVSVEDIYNEFNEGLFDPAAIKAFLKYAYEHWSRPAPTYVFLVGDASMDYRGYLNKAKKNKVPAHLYLSVGSKSLLIPDDNWYVDVREGYLGNYILPEMMIGRMPGDTPETVARLIDKIIRFEESTHESPNKVLLVSDTGKSEENLNDSLIDFLPVGFKIDKVYVRSYLKDAQTDEDKKNQLGKATEDIIASINDGAMVTNYAGHGVVDRWSQSKGLFKPSNVHSLKNQDNLTFVLALTCINGLFTEPSKYALAEEFILATGGAIGVFSSSGLTYSIENEALSREVFSLIFELGYGTLGNITTQAKIAAYNKGISTGVIRSFILFGDPALKLKDWQ